MPIDRWQVETQSAEYYEARLVPALMAPWAPRLVEIADIRSGARVLDVACGTGIVARTVADGGGTSIQVTGLDLNPGMIAVARRLRPDIDWHLGDAANLPFPDASFDRVLCQFGLMFFPDREAALREMRRVLTPEGGIALATWNAIELSPPYGIQADIVNRLAGAEAAAIVRAPFVLSDPVEIERLLLAPGFDTVEIVTSDATVTYPDIDSILEGEIDATPLGSFLQRLDPEILDQVKAEFGRALVPFSSADGVTFPVGVHIATARPR